MFCTIFFFVVLFFGSINCDCPNGAIPWKSSCYLFNSAEVGFVKAEMTCAKNGGHLASIHDAFTNDVIGQNAPDFFTNNSVSDFWIGANSLTVQSIWEWTDESTFDFTDWKKGEPLSDPNHQCASASMTDGYWSSQDCFSTKPFVCVISSGTPSTSTPPMLSSTTTTIAISTVPTTTAPSGPTGNCTTGWIYFNQTNSYYCHLPSKEVNWNDGENFCFITLGGAHLASIHSDEENKFLTSFMISDSFALWTGLHSPDRGTTWHWADRTPTDYLPWYIGEPISGVGNCAVMGDEGFSNDKSVLNQHDCSEEWHIICKIPAS